jgi:hypothetical protein
MKTSLLYFKSLNSTLRGDSYDLISVHVSCSVSCKDMWDQFPFLRLWTRRLAVSNSGVVWHQGEDWPVNRSSQRYTESQNSPMTKSYCMNVRHFKYQSEHPIIDGTRTIRPDSVQQFIFQARVWRDLIFFCSTCC